MKLTIQDLYGNWINITDLVNSSEEETPGQDDFALITDKIDAELYGLFK